MRIAFARSGWGLAVLIAVLSSGSAYGATFFPERGTGPDKSVQALLSNVAPGQEIVQIDDMLFRVSDLKRSGFSGPRWTDGEVFYEFDAAVTPENRARWLNAAQLWSQVSDVSFFERVRVTQENYIRVSDGGGNASSHIGMTGGMQEITISDWDRPYKIAHEIGHALGLIHEHQRTDREAFVQIYPLNIQDPYEGQFSMVESMESYGAYDLDSIMHYHRCAFSVDCPPGTQCDECQLYSIAVLPPNENQQYAIGQRDHLSTLDVQGMHARYYRGEPLVTNVQVSQRAPYAAVIDITYDLETAGDGPVWVNLFLSTNAGLSYPNLCRAVSGDIGAGVLPGISRHIVWDAGTDFPGFNSATCRLRVTADDAPNYGDFVYVSPGTFLMGSPLNELGRFSNEIQHQVTLNNGFYCQMTEVTNLQYVQVAQWAYDHSYAVVTSSYLLDKLDGSSLVLRTLSADYGISFSNGMFSCTDPESPVAYLTWYGAAAYCDWLSMQQGLPRAYNHSTWQCNGGDPYGATGYRLPTEAEWEYACRANSITAFANGPITVPYYCNPIDPLLCIIGWYCGNSESSAKAVTLKAPNGWGLYDMHGNVEEWCNDYYGEYDGEETDPVGPGTGDIRRRRGGNWMAPANFCRSAFRAYGLPSDQASYAGFRPVRSCN